MEQKNAALVLPDASVLRKQFSDLDEFLKIGRKHLFDELHAVHVTALSLSLFDQLKEIHGLAAEDRRLLFAAGILHDIGTCFGYEKHHKKSLELIRKADLPGMDARDQLIAANVARYHRKKEPSRKHKAFAMLEKADRDRVVRLSSLLRIADALDCDHENRIRHVNVYRNRAGLRFSVESSADTKDVLVSFRRKSRLFQDTFHQTLHLQKD